MSVPSPSVAGLGLCDGRAKEILRDGIVKNNPISIQILGICSALAVTNRLENSLVMAVALMVVCALSNLFVSILRNVTPRRIRMIAEMAIISTFVILFDLFLKAYYFEMSKQLGPYVGLIITNCIVMGRAEAFALKNKPVPSFVDGIANGIGYGIVLVFIAFIRELLGTGAIFGATVLPAVYYRPNQLMILAPGAFFVLGVLIAVFNCFSPPVEQGVK